MFTLYCYPSFFLAGVFFGEKMNKLINIIILSMMTICLCGCFAAVGVV